VQEIAVFTSESIGFMNSLHMLLALLAYKSQG